MVAERIGSSVEVDVVRGGRDLTVPLVPRELED
jgi:hypothetical protein